MPPKKSSKSKSKSKAKAPTDTPATDASPVDVESRYKKVDPIEHILLRPEMYVGSIENHHTPMWLFKTTSPERKAMPRMLPAGPTFDKANSAIIISSESNVDEEDDETKKTEEPQEVDSSRLIEEDEIPVKKEESETTKEVEISTEEPDDPDFIAPYDFQEENGCIEGIDKRLLVPGKADMCFPPGSLEFTSTYLNPGLLKIVDEILVNAADNRLTKTKNPQTFIKVYFDESDGTVTIENDGASIPVQKHKEHDMYVPELIFGHLLTSSHYDNDVNSIAAGRHGYGAKLTNILSSHFSVTCINDGNKIECSWTNNMRKHVDSVLSTTDEGDLTKVSFTPEYERFLVADQRRRERLEAENRPLTPEEQASLLPKSFNIRHELHRILLKRCLDLSASIGSEVKVYFNNILLTPRCFSDYVRMHLPETRTKEQPFSISVKNCEYGIICMPNTGSRSPQRHNESLVNGIATIHGGSHVTHFNSIVHAALEKVMNYLKRRNVTFNTHQFRAHCTLFVNVLIPQPKFDSQSKGKLVSKHDFSTFKAELLADHILQFSHLSEFCTNTATLNMADIDAAMKKMQGKGSLMQIIPKLVDPPGIDKPPTEPRTLIVTEGDSAKALAMNSITVEQRSTFGVFPLRGKFINVRSGNLQRLRKNVEAMNLFMALGLKLGKKYTKEDLNTLRYQRLLIMTDQDPDGIHIRGLLISLFHYLWPSLLTACPGYIRVFNTPLIKVQNKGKTLSFFTTREYLQYRESLPQKEQDRLTVKYYKGLGTSTSEEGREYFESMKDYVTEFSFSKEPAQDASLLENAFGKSSVGWRRQWVSSVDLSEDETALDGGIPKKMTVPTFVDKELIHFATYDNYRMLPSVYDGLKVSQRKIIWSLLRKDFATPQRVSQLCGYISEVSQFHHGEASLQGTVVSLAQNFVGSTNINWLVPQGQFGSRLSFGADAAAARYIFTKTADITRYFFPKADDSLLQYTLADGVAVEPRYYVPIVPTALINSFYGIGVGFASRGLFHMPLSVIEATRAMVNGKSAVEAEELLEVGAVGSKGRVVRLRDEHGNMTETYRFYGCCEIGFKGDRPSEKKKSIFVKKVVKGQDGENENEHDGDGEIDGEEGEKTVEVPVEIDLPPRIVIRVTDLPFSMSIDSYRATIGVLFKDEVIPHDYSSGNAVDIELEFHTESFLRRVKTLDEKGILNALGLSLTCSGFYTMLNGENRITEFRFRRHEIMELHYKERLELYGKRLAAYHAKLKEDIKKQSSIIKFSKLVKEKGTAIFKLSEDKLAQKLESLGITKVDDSYDYLTNRSISSLLDVNVATVQKRHDTLVNEEKRSHKEDTAKTLWIADLNAATEATKKMIKDRVAETITKRKPSVKMLPLAEAASTIKTEAVRVGYNEKVKWRCLNTLERMRAKLLRRKKSNRLRRMRKRLTMVKQEEKKMQKMENSFNAAKALKEKCEKKFKQCEKKMAGLKDPQAQKKYKPTLTQALRTLEAATRRAEYYGQYFEYFALRKEKREKLRGGKAKKEQQEEVDEDATSPASKQENVTVAEKKEPKPIVIEDKQASQSSKDSKSTKKSNTTSKGKSGAADGPSAKATKTNLVKSKAKTTTKAKVQKMTLPDLALSAATVPVMDTMKLFAANIVPQINTQPAFSSAYPFLPVSLIAYQNRQVGIAALKRVFRFVLV